MGWILFLPFLPCSRLQPMAAPSVAPGGILYRVGSRATWAGLSPGRTSAGSFFGDCRIGGSRLGLDTWRHNGFRKNHLGHHPLLAVREQLIRAKGCRGVYSDKLVSGKTGLRDAYRMLQNVLLAKRMTCLSHRDALEKIMELEKLKKRAPTKK